MGTSTASGGGYFRLDPFLEIQTQREVNPLFPGIDSEKMLKHANKNVRPTATSARVIPILYRNDNFNNIRVVQQCVSSFAKCRDYT